MRKILYITGTRADYGLMSSVLKTINKDPFFDLTLLVSGMHIQKTFGNSIKYIEEDNYKYEIIDSKYEDNSKEGMSRFLGDFINKATKVISNISPDLIIVLGDRAEALGGAIISSYLSIPLVHFHGGEKSSTVDNVVRNAITQFANFHFPATKNSANRILKMGQDKWRVKNVGAPSLDTILNSKLFPKKNLLVELNLEDKDSILVLQHPVTLEISNSAKQMKNILDSVLEKNMQTIVIYPNADASSIEMIKVIEKYKTKNPNLKVFKTLKYEIYLSLLSFIKVLVGNSSGGLIEAPSFKLPYVLVGNRQNGREKGNNVINVGYSRKDISNGIEIGLSKEFRENIGENPYGDGKTAKKVTKVLKELRLDNNLLEKKLTY